MATENPGGNASEEVIPGVLVGVGKTSLVDDGEFVGAGLSDPLRDLSLNDSHEQIIQESDQPLLLSIEVPRHRQQQ